MSAELMMMGSSKLVNGRDLIDGSRKRRGKLSGVR